MDQFLLFQVQMKSYSSNWNTTYWSLIVTAGEFQEEFRKRFLGEGPALFKSGQWHFHLDNAPVHNSILVPDYLSKMGIKTLSQPPYCPYLALCDFCLFPKLRSYHYETIVEMKEAVTKFIDTLTQKHFPGTFQKWLERYNKCIAAGGGITSKGTRVSCVNYQ